jgi:hypothetical protein
VHNIELNDKTLQAVAEYVNAKNEHLNGGKRADFPVISASNVVESKVRGENIVVLIDGGIKGLAKHTIPCADLNLRKTGRPKKVKDTKENVEV